MDRSFGKNIGEFLALRRNTSLLLGALVLALTGERLWLGFAPKYLETLGGGVLVIGLFDGLQTLLGALYAYPGGWLTDHWGQRRSLLFFNALSLSGYVLVLVWQHWLALLLGAFLFLAWSALSLPATFTVVATSVEARRHTMGIGVQSMVRRVPMMLGPLAGGWLVQHFGWASGMRLALALCIVLALLTTLVQWRMVEPAAAGPGDDKSEESRHKPAPVFRKRAGGPPGMADASRSRRDEAHLASGTGEEPEPQTGALGLEPGARRRASFFDVVRSFSPTLRELLVSDILIRFCERVPFAFVILWAMNRGGLDAAQYSYLVAIEMLTALVCYIPVAHLADKHGRRPFVLATFVFFTLFPVTLLWARNFSGLAMAFAVRGMKEFGEPARKALIMGEAAAELRSRTYGAYYLIRDCVVTSGSFLGAWLWSISPQANFVGAALCGALGTLWFWWYVCRQSLRR
jgi:MFS family permease